MRHLLFLAAMLVLSALPGKAAPKDGTTGRLVVGLKEPATAPVVRELRAALPARILRVGAGGTYLLVQPRPGVTLATLTKSSARIAYVEREILYGATFRVSREVSRER